MSLTPQEILDIVDPTRQHETDTSFAHWYVIDGELVNIYNFEDADDPAAENNNIWYVKETEDPDTGTITKDLTHPKLPEEAGDSDEKPGYWYIKETTDPVTGVVTKELTNMGIPTIELEVNGIWYVDGDTLTHAAFPELVEYGAYFTNQVVTKPIIFPSVMEIGEWAFAETTSLFEVYLNPECKRYPTSFPPECVVKDWPLSYRVTRMPTKTTYNVGEAFDMTGIEVIGNLDMTVVGKEYGSYSYTMNNNYLSVLTFDNTSPGEKTVTLKYKPTYSVREYNIVLPETVTVV